MQGEESLWTVEECLRGRLFAERVASKTANDNAELLDLKLKELEKQLKIETKFRKKAEKKLNLLKKKLESLNISISVFSEESQQSISSDRSCISSIASNSSRSSINQQDQCLLTPEVSNSNSVNSVVTDKVDSDIHLLLQMTDIHDSGRKNDNSSTLEPQLLENHDGSKSLSLLYKNSNEDIHQKNDADSIDNVDNNSMALAVVDPVVECNDSCNQVSEVTDDAVREVLFTLKQIKQDIQCRLKSRGVIKGS